MIYTHVDRHPIVTALKKKGWVLFDVTAARTTEANGISGGWWIDCAVSFGTEHYKTHRIINGKWLGATLKDALKEVNSDKFPSNTE